MASKKLQRGKAARKEAKNPVTYFKGTLYTAESVLESLSYKDLFAYWFWKLFWEGWIIILIGCIAMLLQVFHEVGTELAKRFIDTLYTQVQHNLTFTKPGKITETYREENEKTL